MNSDAARRELDRREFIKLGLGAASLLALGNGSGPLIRAAGTKATARKVIVLGFDGMDPRLVRAGMDQGKLPALKKLAAEGGFKPLQTSVPSQSPVAWSNFIAGTDPGGHGIFDFVHRDPATYVPVFSASATTGAVKTLRLGNWVFPLSGGHVTNLRRGKDFWQIMEEHDIPATIFKIPSNYPPVPTKQRTIAGMGTPDLKGSYGIFNYYTNEPKDLSSEAGGGGRVHEVYVIGNRVEASLPGPDNSFRKGHPETAVDFKVFIDPDRPMAKIAIAGQEFILKENEWSGWKKIRFGLIPTQDVAGNLPVLSQGSPAEIQAVCQPGQHRPGGSGPADFDSRILRGGSGEDVRTVLHQGTAGRHERPGQRRPGRRGIPGTG